MADVMNLFPAKICIFPENIFEIFCTFFFFAVQTVISLIDRTAPHLDFLWRLYFTG